MSPIWNAFIWHPLTSALGPWELNGGTAGIGVRERGGVEIGEHESGGGERNAERVVVGREGQLRLSSEEKRFLVGFDFGKKLAEWKKGMVGKDGEPEAYAKTDKSRCRGAITAIRVVGWDLVDAMGTKTCCDGTAREDGLKHLREHNMEVLDMEGMRQATVAELRRMRRALRERVGCDFNAEPF